MNIIRLKVMALEGLTDPNILNIAINGETKSRVSKWETREKRRVRALPPSQKGE